MTMTKAPEARPMDKPEDRSANPPADLAPLVAPLLERMATDPNARAHVLHQLLGEAACRQIGIYPIPPGFKLSVVIPVYNEERWLAELVRRGWSDEELKRLASGNILRAMREAEAVARRLQASRPPSLATIQSLDGPK